MLLTTILFGLPLIGFACAKTAQPFPTPQVEKRLEPYCVNGVRGPPSKTWDSGKFIFMHTSDTYHHTPSSSMKLTRYFFLFKSPEMH